LWRYGKTGLGSNLVLDFNNIICKNLKNIVYLVFNYMKIILFIIVFLIVLFIYVHLNYQISTSNDLEIYEIENPWSKSSLDEVCYSKQPVRFMYNNNDIIDNINLSFISQQYNAFDVKIRKMNETDDKAELYLPFSVGEVSKLLENDVSGVYITENNIDFLEETNLIKVFKYNDDVLRPPLVSNCNYDFISSSLNTNTLLQYKLNYRNFFLVTEGSVKLKLISPDYTKYLHVNKDYYNFLFTSPINCWDIQREYSSDYNKVKSMEIILKQGDIIFIPAYWWYSFSFLNISTIACFHYRTYANTLSISPEICKSMLQKQNIKRNKNNVVSFDDNQE
jgi:hypothetical protein